MPKPNTMIKLSIEDMELIEDALKVAQGLGREDPQRLQEVLGRLHNQRVFYRPSGTYVSG